MFMMVKFLEDEALFGPVPHNKLPKLDPRLLLQEISLLIVAALGTPCRLYGGSQKGSDEC